MPVTPELQLLARRQYEYGLLKRGHGRAYYIWARVNTILLTAIAIAGTLTGVSAVAEDRELTVALSLVTAILSGLNAGMAPAAKAADHQSSRTAYEFACGKVDYALTAYMADDEESVKSIEGRLAPIAAELKEVAGKRPNLRPRGAEVNAARENIIAIVGEEIGPSLTKG